MGKFKNLFSLAYLTLLFISIGIATKAQEQCTIHIGTPDGEGIAPFSIICGDASNPVWANETPRSFEIPIDTEQYEFQEFYSPVSGVIEGVYYSVSYEETSGAFKLTVWAESPTPIDGWTMVTGGLILMTDDTGLILDLQVRRKC